MSLKVIAGVHGGRVLRTVRDLGTRPLLGQVKGAIFNILAEEVPGAVVWDLFAGTGSNGIESLSRGARHAVFVEKNNRALEVLRGNLRMLGPAVVTASSVVRADAWEPPVVHAGMLAGGETDDLPVPGVAAAADAPAAGELAATGVPEQSEVSPDLVFLDPPYALVLEDPVKCLYRARRLVQRLAPRGCLVFHFEAGALDEDDFDADLVVDLRQWGSSAVAFLWRAGEAPAQVVRRRERALSEE